MTITSQQYAALLERVQKLETKFSEWQSDYELLKEKFMSMTLSTNELFDAIITKHNQYRDNLTLTMKVVMEHNRALFPERYVEGASPALRLTLDPDKMV